MWLGADAMSQLCDADEVDDPLVHDALRACALDKHAVRRHCCATGGVAKNMETLAGPGAPRAKVLRRCLLQAVHDLSHDFSVCHLLHGSMTHRAEGALLVEVRQAFDGSGGWDAERSGPEKRVDDLLRARSGGGG